MWSASRSHLCGSSAFLCELVSQLSLHQGRRYRCIQVHVQVPVYNVYIREVGVSVLRTVANANSLSVWFAISLSNHLNAVTTQRHYTNRIHYQLVSNSKTISYSRLLYVAKSLHFLIGLGWIGALSNSKQLQEVIKGYHLSRFGSILLRLATR